MTQRWDTARLGCITRDSVEVRPNARTAQTRAGGLPIQSKTADVRAPLVVKFESVQTRAQFANFRQWVQFDLAGGARPFVVDLWLYGQVRRVRARMLASWTATRSAFNSWVTDGHFEIERESMSLDFEAAADVARSERAP